MPHNPLGMYATMPHNPQPVPVSRPTQDVCKYASRPSACASSPLGTCCKYASQPASACARLKDTTFLQGFSPKITLPRSCPRTHALRIFQEVVLRPFVAVRIVLCKQTLKCPVTRISMTPYPYARVEQILFGANGRQIIATNFRALRPKMSFWYSSGLRSALPQLYPAPHS